MHCCLVWSNSSNFNVSEINKLQRRACKIILSHDYKSLNESLEHLYILSFAQSVFLNKAKLMYKIYNNMAPRYLHEMFHMGEINLDTTISNLRSVAIKNYVLPQAKYNLFKDSLSLNSLSSSGVLVLTSIPLDIKISSSLQMFINGAQKGLNVRLRYDEVVNLHRHSLPPSLSLCLSTASISLNAVFAVVSLYIIACVAHVYLFSYS